MTMTIVNQQANFITQVFNNAINQALTDPAVNQFAGHIQQNVNNFAFPEVQLILQEMFDTGVLQWSEQEGACIINSVVRGFVFSEISRINQQAAPQSMVGDYNYIFEMAERRKQQAPPQQNIHQPYQQQYQQQPVQQQNFQQQQQYPQQQSHGTITSHAVPHAPNAPVHNNSNLAPSTLTMTQGNEMDHTQHLPDHTNKAPADIYEFNNETIAATPVVDDPPVQSTDVKRIAVIDKSDLSFSNSTTTTTCAIFTTVKEALVKPMLVSITERRFLPAFSPSPELGNRIIDFVNVETVDDMFDNMMGLSREFSIPGVVAWIDHRVSHMVEMTIQHRYGYGDTVVPNYREEQDDIDGWLDSLGPGVKEDIHQVILDTVNESIHSVEMSENVAEHVDFLEVTSEVNMLTLPWALRYNREAHSVFIDDVSKGQVNDILDQVWELVDNNPVSVLITDMSGMRYRAYRKGTAEFTTSEYYFEHLGF